MTPAEVIENALSVMGVDAPEDGATVVLGHIDQAGLVVVSAEDLRAAVEVLAAVNDPWRHVSEEPELEARLRATLPEETTTGG